jgi:hypothetical protein
MPTTIYDSSLLTKRRQAKTIANSFLQRLNTQGTVNQTTSYGPLLGVYDASIMNEVKNGTIQYIEKCEGGNTAVDPGCCPDPVYGIPGPVSSFFIYLNCVIVTWAAPANSAGPIAYSITATSSDGGVTVSGTSNTNSYSFNTLTPYTHYTFKVTAYNNSGYSSPVTSYSIYAPPNTSISYTTSLALYSNDAMAVSFPATSTPYGIVKQNSNNYKCYGTLNEIGLLYSASSLGIGQVFPLSELILYATLFSTIGAAPGIGIYKTIDGGLSWNSITSGKIFTDAVDFPDLSYWWNENEGVAVGDSTTANNSNFYYTTNGGSSWTVSSVQLGPLTPTAGVAGSQYVSAIGNTVWVYAYEYTAPYKIWIYKSIDKGQNFTSIKVNSINNVPTGTGGVSFADSSNGVVYTTQNFYYTTNGGSSWTEVSSVYTTLGPLLNIFCIDNTSYVLASSEIDGRTQSTLYKSTNIFTGAPTFTAISNIDYLTQVAFSSSSSGYATSNFSNGLIKKYLGTNSPSVPTINGLYPGAGSVAIEVITSNYEFPVTNINVIPYDSNGSALATQNFTSIPFNVTGLTNGQSYRFKIQAVSTSGSSAYSDFSSVIIPNSPIVPQPTWVVGLNFANAGGGVFRAFLRFLKPMNDGGSAITSYTSVITQVNGTTTITPGITGPTSTITLPTTSSINNAVVYAVNAVGQAVGFYNSIGATTYNSIRIPTITLSSSGVGTYTVSVTPFSLNTTFTYNIFSINNSSFILNNSCSPNSYTTIPLTSSPQSITVTGLTAGTYSVLVRIVTPTGAAAISNVLPTVTVT